MLGVAYSRHAGTVWHECGVTGAAEPGGRAGTEPHRHRQVGSCDGHRRQSTGWSVELVSPIKVENKEFNSIQVRYRGGSKLEKLADKRVKASGKIAVQHGRETGAYPVLEISSIKEVKTTAARTTGQTQ